MDKPLTFAELEVGDHFLAFPIEGDHNGQVFKKISNITHPQFLYNNVEKLSDGSTSHIPQSMRVVKVTV